MWFYLGILTTVIATIIRFYQKLRLQSELQDRPKNLIPVHGKYKYEWSPPHENAPSYGYLEIPCKTNTQFSVRAEHWFDRWSKRIGLSYECQTGHPELDQKIYLTNITESDAEYIGSHSALPQQILAILSNGKSGQIINTENTLICDGQHLFLKIANPDKTENTQAQFISNNLELLKSIAEELQASPPELPHFWKVPTHRNSAIILAISSTIAVLGGLEFFRFFVFGDNQLLAPWAMVSSAVIVALIAASLMIGFVLKALPVSARRHIILAEVCIVGFSGLVFASYGWLYDLNMRIHPQKTTYQYVSIVNKYIVHHTGRRTNYDTYHFSIKPVSAPLKNELSVSFNDYLRTQNGNKLKISIKSGYLNHPWLYSIEKYGTLADSSK